MIFNIIHFAAATKPNQLVCTPKTATEKPKCANNFLISLFQRAIFVRMEEVLGVPSFLNSGCLPTKTSVFNDYMQFREEGVTSGKWEQNVPFSEVVRTVSECVKEQRETTDMPTLFSSDTVKAYRKVSEVVIQARSLLKTPKARRKK